MSELDEMIVASPEVFFGVVDESLLLFDPRDRRLHVLNSTAAMTWALTDAPCSARSIIEALAKDFEVPPSQIEDEVLSTLGQLIEARLCVVGQTSPVPPLPGRPAASNPDYEALETTLGPYSVMGAVAIVDVTDTRLRDELQRVLSPLLDGAADPTTTDRLLHYVAQRSGDGFNLSVNGETLARGTKRSTCKRSLLSDLNSNPMRFIDDAIVLHAGSVEIDGRILTFPGRSNSGKSTLVARLLSRGASYLTDEALEVSLSGQSARPYHKSICLDAGGQRVFPMLNPETSGSVADATWDVDPRQVGAGVFSEGGPVSGIVFPTYKVGQADPALELLDQVEVARMLLANTFDFVPLGQAAFAVLIRLANTVPGYALSHGGRGEVEVVEGLVESLPRSVEPVETE